MTGEYQFERFLRAVHRRMVLLRGLERIGLCLLGGCVVALILMPILIWRGQGTGELAAAILGAAGVAGLGWAVAARPTKLAAAMEADRQLRLSDLLGTALVLRRTGGGGDIEKSVLAMAEARCRQASPSAVALNRLGARSWGGIGLAGALVAGLSLMGGDPNRSAAHAAAGPRSWREIEVQQETGNASQFATAADLRRAKPGGGGDDDDPLNSAASHPEQPTGATTANQASTNGAGGAQEGTGAGAGQSASKGYSGTPLNPSAGGNAHGTNPAATSGGGGGTASEAGGNVGGPAGATAGVTPARKPAPVWRGAGWPADQDAARAAIRNGRVPDAYRDLVRDYFERE